MRVGHVGHGGNVELKSRDLSDYQVSVLETVGNAATEADIQAMFAAVGAKDFPEMYAHIDAAVKFPGVQDLPDELEYQALADRMESLSKKNSVKTAFLGDGLQVYRTNEIVGHVCSIRNLTTSYTPYQPERSQGTLITHWIYQSTLAQLTGFEAVNSSLYERASALFEAAVCAVRMGDAEANTVLVAANLLPGDLEVLRTHVADTSVKLEFLAADEDTGRLSAAGIAAASARLGKQLAAVIFPQVNALGLLEDVDALTDACATAGVKSIAVIAAASVLLAPGVSLAQKSGAKPDFTLDPNYGSVRLETGFTPDP